MEIGLSSIYRKHSADFTFRIFILRIYERARGKTFLFTLRGGGSCHLHRLILIFIRLSDTHSRWAHAGGTVLRMLCTGETPFCPFKPLREELSSPLQPFSGFIAIIYPRPRGFAICRLKCAPPPSEVGCVFTLL